MDWLWRIWAKVESVDPLSWVSHTVISLCVAAVVGGVFHGPGTLMAFWGYLFREADQAITAWRAGAPQHWRDRIEDVSVPAFVLGFVHIWLGW